MVEVINLKRARKTKAKAKAEEAAARNRAIHGQSSAERKRLNTERNGTERRLDGHQLEPQSKE